MKNRKKGISQPHVMLLLGILAMLLRRMLYLTAVDEKGHLVRNSPLSWMLLALTVVAALLAMLSARKQETADSRGRFYGFFSAMGHAAIACGILVTVLTGSLQAPGFLGSAWRLLGWAAPLCLLAAGAACMLDKKPFFLLYVAVCLFFMVHIVCHYQSWSADPQMQDYLFALLGAMALAFCSFYTAAAAAGCGSPRMKRAMELAALYLCLAEQAGSRYPLLYLGGLLWVLTNLLPAGERD